MDKSKNGANGAGSNGVKGWIEGVDYAYEYVPVSQRREGRQNIRYELTMRQQPVQARMCGVGEKSDRRPVDPTPIVQLKVTDDNGDDITPVDSRYRGQPSGMNFMQNPYYFLFACLVDGDSDENNEDELHIEEDGKTRFLTGTPVSSLYHLKDLDNSDAAFFVFPDLGVRKEGRYRLKLTLFEIVGQEVFYCTTMYTAVFSVFSAKKFPGMKKATDLSKSFADQGLKIRVRKDGKQTPGRPSTGKRKSSANESDGEHDGPPKRSRGQSPGPLQEAEPRCTSVRPGEQPYHPQGPPHGGYHSGYPPGYYEHGQHGQHGRRMAPPPPPGAYDPYRSAPPQHAEQVPHGYHPGYPPQHYGAGSGRPVTHPGPYRQHQSLPPQGYPPEYAQHPQHHQPQHPYQHGYANGPPPHSSSPYSADRALPGAGVPWPQQERRLPSRGHPQLPPHPQSQSHPQQQPPHSARLPRPLSPRSRDSPTRPPLPYELSPDSSSASSSMMRPGSSSRPHSRGGGVTLPPLNLATAPSSRSRSSIGSTTMFSPLISVSSERSRERERDGQRPIDRDRDMLLASPSDSLSRHEPRSASMGGGADSATGGTGGTGSTSNNGSRASTPGTGKTNRMGLGHLVD